MTSSSMAEVTWSIMAEVTSPSIAEVTSSLIADDSSMSMISNVTTSVPEEEEAVSSSKTCDKCANIAYVIIGLIGILGNLLVIVVMSRTPKMRKQVTSLLIVNQSALDMLSAFLQTGTNIVYLFYDITFDFRGAELVCRTFYNQVFIWSVLVSSSYNLIALNLERYFRIVHPIIHKVSFTRAKAKVMCVCIWLSGLVINFYGFFASGVRGKICLRDSIWPQAWMGTFIGFFKLIVQFFLPVFVMVYSYAHMLVAIRRRSSIIAPELAPAAHGGNQVQSAANIAKQRKNVHIQKNIFKTLAIVTICFIVCWSWNQFFIMLYYIDYPVDWDTAYYHFSVFMVMLNCSCNPIIYTISYDQFRTGLKSFLLREKRTAISGSTTSAHSHTHSTISKY